MDKLLQAALERRDALRAELSAIDDLIMRLQQLEGDEGFHNHTSGQPTFSFKIRNRRGLTPEELEALLTRASELILEAGRPLTRTELLHRLEGEGFKIYGRDRSKVLGTNLWRSGRFKSTGEGYWPIERPLPDDLVHKH